jgi:hypothetical protein
MTQRRFNVVLTYTTHADDPKDAISMAISAVNEGNVFVEVVDDEIDVLVLEGELHQQGVT